MPKETAYQVYVDEGYSGKDFFRPAWQQLIRDCQNGKINCLLVRDLSRMGRDYLQVGEYMERFFPGHQIRLVAIAVVPVTVITVCYCNQTDLMPRKKAFHIFSNLQIVSSHTRKIPD